LAKIRELKTPTTSTPTASTVPTATTQIAVIASAESPPRAA
jgi:hypothetical protein